MYVYTYTQIFDIFLYSAIVKTVFKRPILKFSSSYIYLLNTIQFCIVSYTLRFAYITSYIIKLYRYAKKKHLPKVKIYGMSEQHLSLYKNFCCLKVTLAKISTYKRLFSGWPHEIIYTIHNVSIIVFSHSSCEQYFLKTHMSMYTYTSKTYISSKNFKKNYRLRLRPHPIYLDKKCRNILA